jgi:hypothetical protein
LVVLRSSASPASSLRLQLPRRPYGSAMIPLGAPEGGMAFNAGALAGNSFFAGLVDRPEGPSRARRAREITLSRQQLRGENRCHRRLSLPVIALRDSFDESPITERSGVARSVWVLTSERECGLQSAKNTNQPWQAPKNRSNCDSCLRQLFEARLEDKIGHRLASLDEAMFVRTIVGPCVMQRL